uniref:Uncharacterized protein n=1 Tax=Plectus sambesii TaxID=2011161 RepID=A0A914UVA6_9BILA
MELAEHIELIEVPFVRRAHCPIWVDPDSIRPFSVKQKHLGERTDEKLNEGISVFLETDEEKIARLLEMALKDEVPVDMNSKSLQGEESSPRLLLVYKMGCCVGYFSQRSLNRDGDYHYGSWCETSYLAIALKSYADGFWRVCSCYPRRPVR